MLKTFIWRSGLAVAALLTSLALEVRAESYSVECVNTLSEADQLYLEGNTTAAESLYRQCKSPGDSSAATFFPEPVTDINQLSPAAQVYWREAQEGQSREQA